jgi:hypothetical protein
VDYRGGVSNLVLSIVFCTGSMPESGVVIEEGLTRLGKDSLLTASNE